MTPIAPFAGPTGKKVPQLLSRHLPVRSDNTELAVCTPGRNDVAAPGKALRVFPGNPHGYDRTKDEKLRISTRRDKNLCFFALPEEFWEDPLLQTEGRRGGGKEEEL